MMTGQNQCLEKYRRMKAGEENPLINPNAWREFLADVESRFHRMLEEERLGTDRI